MPDPIKVEVTRNELSVQEPNTTTIKSIELVNALVVAPADAWQSIAAAFGTIVSTDDVRVSNDGRIIINDEIVTAKVKEILEDQISGAAGVCVPFLCANYKCGAI